MKKVVVFFACVLCCVSLHAKHDKPRQPNDSAPLKVHDSLRYKIAQLLIVGFRGTELNRNSHIYHDVHTLGVGGVILFDYDVEQKTFGRNITSPRQLKRLCRELHRASKGNLVIAIDQEGGKVSRLKPSAGFPPTVSAQYLGKIDKADTTKFYAVQTAELLREMGINFNFSPCVDLNVNPACPVIGKLGRSFSALTPVVVRHARLWMDEHRRRGVLCSIKHFPGHGSSTADSHLGLADVSSMWSRQELSPYELLMTSGLCDAVMLAHVFNKNIDAKYPASLSKKTVDGMLRKTLHFDGLVLTDDLAMMAITKYYSLATALEKALNAGVDMLVLSNNGNAYDPQLASKAVDIIYNLVKSNAIPNSRIDEAYARKMRTFAALKNAVK